MATVEVSRVTAVYPVHHLEQVALRCLQYDVIVIVHEHIAVYEYSISLTVLAKYVEESHPVGVIKNYLLSLVPPACDVIQRPGILNSQRSAHGVVLCRRLQLYQR